MTTCVRTVQIPPPLGTGEAGRSRFVSTMPQASSLRSCSSPRSSFADSPRTRAARREPPREQPRPGRTRPAGLVDIGTVWPGADSGGRTRRHRLSCRHALRGFRLENRRGRRRSQPPRRAAARATSTAGAAQVTAESSRSTSQVAGRGRPGTACSRTTIGATASWTNTLQRSRSRWNHLRGERASAKP
jgi:hypothetical protein